MLYNTSIATSTQKIDFEDGLRILKFSGVNFICGTVILPNFIAMTDCDFLDIEKSAWAVLR